MAKITPISLIARLGDTNLHLCWAREMKTCVFVGETPHGPFWNGNRDPFPVQIGTAATSPVSVPRLTATTLARHKQVLQEPLAYGCGISDNSLRGLSMTGLALEKQPHVTTLGFEKSHPLYSVLQKIICFRGESIDRHFPWCVMTRSTS